MTKQNGAQGFQGAAEQFETVAAGMFVRLLEEMLDLKIQQHIQPHVPYTPEIAQVMQRKRQADQHRLQQIRAELIGLMKA